MLPRSEQKGDSKISGEGAVHFQRKRNARRKVSRTMGKEGSFDPSAQIPNEEDFPSFLKLVRNGPEKTDKISGGG